MRGPSSHPHRWLGAAVLLLILAIRYYFVRESHASQPSSSTAIPPFVHSPIPLSSPYTWQQVHGFRTLIPIPVLFARSFYHILRGTSLIRERV
ncbi:hypothetical protein F5Y09DRAFT_307699 [Xylaria sp. FL1042]|nr:hypothetical protein F5Y09DRAFT_307699 [Xylaria sp. FL1042]